MKSHKVSKCRGKGNQQNSKKPYIDIGSGATIISEDTFKEIARGKSEVQPATVKLRTYTGESVKVLGTVNIMVNYEQQKEESSPLIDLIHKWWSHL